MTQQATGRDWQCRMNDVLREGARNASFHNLRCDNGTYGNLFLTKHLEVVITENNSHIGRAGGLFSGDQMLIFRQNVKNKLGLF